MKPWQHGYALDELRALRQLFNRYEPFSFGRFAIPDEAQIALALHQQEAALLYADGKPAGMMIGKIAQRDSPSAKTSWAEASGSNRATSALTISPMSETSLPPLCRSTS